MAPHRPRKSAPTEYATDEEDMITYDVEEDELEPDTTKPNKSPNTPAVTTSSSSTQVYLLPSNSSIAVTMSDPQPTIPVSNAVLSTTNNMSTSVGSSSVMSGSGIQHTSEFSTIPDLKKMQKPVRGKEITKLKMNEEKIELKMAPLGPQISSHEEYTTDEEDMIVYDMGEELENHRRMPVL
ncbi:hypothetical protein TNCV_4075601 [Trichonephila clavipes]|nr:hypothetical protein TNCV_4075601 [Trichonephila clavipes]